MLPLHTEAGQQLGIDRIGLRLRIQACCEVLEFVGQHYMHLLAGTMKVMCQLFMIHSCGLHQEHQWCIFVHLTGCPSHQLVEACLRIVELLRRGTGQLVIFSFGGKGHFEVIFGDVYSYALYFHRVGGLNCDRTDPRHVTHLPIEIPFTLFGLDRSALSTVPSLEDAKRAGHSCVTV